MDDSTPDNKTWSLIAGVALIALSLWVLHKFCDEYAASPMTQQVVPSVETDEVPPIPADPVCSKWLGTISGGGAAGIVFLLTAWLLSLLSHTSDLQRLAAKLAVVGRLIALGCLGAVILVLVMYNVF